MTRGCECTRRHHPLLLDMPLVSRSYSSTASVGRNAQTHGKLPRRTPSSGQTSSQVFLACYGRHGSAFSSHDVPQDDGRLRRENKLSCPCKALRTRNTPSDTLCACVDSTRNRDRLRYCTPGADQAQHRHRDERRGRVSMALMSLIKLAKCLQESEGNQRHGSTTSTAYKNRGAMCSSIAQDGWHNDRPLDKEELSGVINTRHNDQRKNGHV